MNPIHSMLAALCATLVLEVLFALLWGVRKRGLLIVILMNIMTNPAANLLHHLGITQWHLSRAVCVVVLELGVFVVEALCSRGLIRKPWLFSFLVNLFSYSVGLIISIFY